MKLDPRTWFRSAPAPVPAPAPAPAPVPAQAPKPTPAPVTVGRVRAATTPNSADTPENAKYWRRLGERSSRNLADVDHRRMVEECSHSAQVDGMARAHVRLVTSITVGAQEIDPTIECADDAARETLGKLLRTFWRARPNRLHESLEQFMSGLTTTGSLCLTLHTAKDENGRGSLLTSVGYLDPAAFVAPYVLTDSANVRDPIAVLRGTSFGARKVIAHPIVRPDGTRHEMVSGKEGSQVRIERSDESAGPLDVVLGAPCMYLGANMTSPSQTCGISDLYPALDLMHLLDELVFNSVERSINLAAYSLHVKFPAGTSAADIATRMDTIRADLESGKGRAVGTTDDVTITAVAAALQAGEWATLEKVARTNALISLGPWPVHIFSEGAGTNVTAAAEQGSAIANFLLSRQNAFRRYMVDLCMYAIRQYPEGAALLDANEDASVVLPLPMIVARNSTRESNVLQVEAGILANAADRGNITVAAEQREFGDAAKRYGFRIGPEDVPPAAEIEERRRAPVLSLPPIQPDADVEDPDTDPRGGHREGEDDKVPEGTPETM